jgi:tripeptidyl-peptidase-1
MYEFAQSLYARDPAPLVVSMSWGWTETQQCSITSCNGATNAQYISATDSYWLKLTTRGVTIVASSGDQGAPGDANPNCVLGTLSVLYPAVSPYILSVGATALQEPAIQPPPPPNQTPMCAAVGCSQSTTEIICTYPNALITTGGGFSQTEPISSATWQQSAVSGYVNSAGSLLPPQNLWPANGRVTPDVSALGHNYVIVVEGEYELVDGTSCSAPYWGGIIALLNDALMNNGKQPLGFINPTLYNLYATNPSVFNDIVGGNNACTEKCCSPHGFPAIKGYDAATGLGTPNYPNLYQAIIGTPVPN